MRRDAGDLPAKPNKEGRIFITRGQILKYDQKLTRHRVPPSKTTHHMRHGALDIPTQQGGFH
jgi:hypothetical protein